MADQHSDPHDELLTRLGAAFAVEPAEPPAEGLAALRGAVAELRAGDAAGGTRRVSRWRRPLPVGGLVFGLIVGGTGTALAAGAPLPRPLRSLAHGIGLPVDSPQLHDVREANHRLRDDLSTPTTSPATAHDAAELARKLAGLDADERSKVEAESEHLLGQARGPDTASGQSGPSASGGPDAGGAGPSSGSGDSGDHHGGTGPSSGSGGTSGSGGDGSGSGSGSDGSGSGSDHSTATSTPTATPTTAPASPPTTTSGDHGSDGGGSGSDSGTSGGGGSDGSGGGSGPG